MRDETNKPQVMTPADIVAYNVKLARNAAGYRQADLADRMSQLGFNWTAQTVSEIERPVGKRARRSIKVEELIGLVVALGTTVSALFDPRSFGMPGGESIAVDAGIGNPVPFDDFSAYIGRELGPTLRYALERVLAETVSAPGTYSSAFVDAWTEIKEDHDD